MAETSSPAWGDIIMAFVMLACAIAPIGMFYAGIGNRGAFVVAAFYVIMFFIFVGISVRRLRAQRRNTP